MKRSISVMLLPLMSYAAAMHMALMLFAFKDAPIADHTGMLIWWAFLLVEYIVMALYLRRPRELRGVVLVSVGVGVCQLLVTLWLAPVYPTFVWWAAAVFMWAALYYRCVFAFLYGVKPEAMMTNFEVTALALFAAAVTVGGGAVDGGILAHLIVGLLCSLAGLMGVRTMHTRLDTQEERPMVRLLPPLLLLGMLAAVVLFCLLAGGQAAELLGRLAVWLGCVGKMLVQAVGAFIFWLFSLLPEPETDLDSEAFEGVALPSGTAESVTQSSGVLLYILIAAFVGALLIVLVKLWRKVRVKSAPRQVRRTKAAVVNKRSLWDVLLGFVQKVSARLRYEWTYLCSRNTPQGLLVWLERRMRRGRGETPAAYLTRVAQRIPQCSQELKELSRCLDRLYFGGGDTIAPDAVRDMRRALKKAFTDRK